MVEYNKVIIFLADAWGAKYGGINTFNKDLCVAMGYVLPKDIKVVCLILGTIDEDSFYDALQQNVYLISYNKKNTELISKDYKQIKERIEEKIGLHKLTICIGHDIFTGENAIKLSNELCCKSGLIVHTDYPVIEGLKENTVNGISKEIYQRSLIENADYVFAVGPRLCERALEVRQNCVFEIIPGLNEMGANLTKNHRTIMTFGRFDGSISPVKQSNLACAAFGRAIAMVNNCRDYVLQIFGVDNSNTEANDIANRFAKKKVSIILKPYTENRDELFKALQNNCAFMMLSLSEGFGLSAWEAIAAEIPIIITKNSGVYDFLYRELGYLINGLCLPVDISGVYDINNPENSRIKNDDIEVVAQKLQEVLLEPDKLRDSARMLKDRLKKYTWERTAISISNICGLTNISVDALSYSENFYDIIFRNRQLCLDHVFQRVKDKQIRKRIVFFGGISNRLCKEESIQAFCSLLKNITNLKIYFCYEKGEVALRRAAELNPKVLPKDELSQDPMVRMNRKAEKIEASHDLYAKDVKDRVYYIPLSKAPNSYFIILDDDLYFSLLLETRSTNSTTIKVKNSNEAIEEREKMLNHMAFILNESAKDSGVIELLNIINEMKNINRR